MRAGGSWRRGLSAGVLLAAGLVGGVASGAAKGPTVVVVPATGLHNREIVKVHGAGFKPKDLVFIVECLATAKGQKGCDTSNPISVTITAKGVLPVTKVRVVTGKIGSGTCGTTAKNLGSCAISVGNISGHDTASARIVFKKP